jgi:hypothetical protein
MGFKKLFVLMPISLALLSACEGDSTYTLYRTSPVPIDNPSLQRIHVATFDSYNNESYNRENCQLAAKLFQSQQGVIVKYWCEKGKYKK